MQNSTVIFNYYLARTPDRGYFIIGLNYSNPKWTQATTTNAQITLSSDLGAQLSIGLSLVKGVIFDITVRAISAKLNSIDPVTATFEDFGRGQTSELQVGFKFIL